MLRKKQVLVILLVLVPQGVSLIGEQIGDLCRAVALLVPILVRLTCVEGGAVGRLADWSMLLWSQ